MAITLYFGLRNPDEAGNPLFLEGDRGRWYMVQPYLIAMLMSNRLEVRCAAAAGDRDVMTQLSVMEVRQVVGC